ncbi:hypothetical protein D918_01537 [Trichuris suis]|nr:hypothetical protein D918_01537 [Trichuris suis]
MTFDCCAALEPPTMWIAPRRDDAANIDVPDLEKEEPLGGAKKCTCKAAHAHKEKAAAAEPPVSHSRAAVIVNEPKCFPEQTEEQRREFERKRDAHYANEAIIAQKILRNEMTPEEAQAMLGISNPWAEEEKKKKQKSKSGKKSSLKKKKAKEKQHS